MVVRRFQSLLRLLRSVVLLAVTVAVAASAESPLHRMTSWFHSLSNTNKRVSFRHGERGSGVYVNKHRVADKDRVMAVPMHHVFSAETVAGRTYGYLLQGLEEDDAIALAVIAEMAFGTGSKLEPWISALPALGEGLDPPVVWPQNEIDLILPSTTRFEVIQRRRDAHVEYLKLVSSTDVVHELEAFLERVLERDAGARKVSLALAAGLPDGKSAAGREARVKLLSIVTEERLNWAHSLLDTRAWNLNGKKYFVPGADMFNHAPDSDDTKFDPLQRRLLRQRSQKFVVHHQVNAQVPGEDADMRYAVVLSDRGGVAAGEELFESYGDNTDAIYFTYHGFVPSRPEDFVPLTNDTAKSEKKRLAFAWRDERELRNAWDCQLIQLRPSKWSPVQDTLVGHPRVKGSKAQLAARERLKLGKARPPKVEPKERQLTQDEAAASDWFRERIFPIARPHSNRAGATTCAFYGELDPVLAIFHLVLVLPKHVVESNCMREIKVRDSNAKYHKELWPLYAKVLQCADGQTVLPPGGADSDTPVTSAAWELAGLRSLRASMDWHFINHEFPGWGGRGMPLADEALEIQSLLNPGQSTLSGQARTRRIMRLRFALQRKMIAREAYRLLKRRMRDAKQRIIATNATAETPPSHRDEL